MARSAFVAKLEEDIQLIQAFPPQLRWFVQDDEDALFLLGATTRVFDLPRKAEVHRGEFLVACLERGAKKDPEGTGEARGHDT
jgi:hypothetical protein